MTKLILTSALLSLLSLAATDSDAQGRAPTCADLNWSAQVLAANPDIAASCRGVYVRKDIFYAKVRIRVERVRGNALTFKPVHTDGVLGKARRITVPNAWRAKIDGRSYRAGELPAGQELSIYIPEDRFALHVEDGGPINDAELLEIEEAAVVTMPEGDSR